MKKYEFYISKNILEKFFPKKRVKTKAQIIEILMEATRYMLVNPTVKEENVAGKIILFMFSAYFSFFMCSEITMGADGRAIIAKGVYIAT